MITSTIVKDVAYNKLFKFTASSTDEKPVGTYEGMKIPQGSILTEVDTSKRFLYSEEESKWYEDTNSIATAAQIEEAIDSVRV